jgi:glycosyltransferase involved in cell wall biosynthesis
MISTVMVVPCYNEARRLVPEAFRAFAQAWGHGRFLFVDDGSTDDTFAVLAKLKATFPESFDVLRLPSNAGKAEAVRQGFLQALRTDPEYVGFWDSDLATPLEAIPLFESVFRDRPQTEVVLGARVKLLGRDVRRTAVRHYLGRAFATAVAVVSGLEVYDSQCGAKLFRATSTVRSVFATPFQSRWIFDVEILVRFVRLKQPQAPLDIGACLYELPLPVWRDVPGSKLRPKDFGRALLDLVRIYRAPQ